MFPEKLSVANIPTKIEPIRYNDEFSLYIKRDDQTGTEFAGNKIRKLEYAVKEALDQGCDTLITCGGIQSNHARSTAAIAARLGLQCHLFLRSDERKLPQGNHLLDHLLGAKVHRITAEEYRNSRTEMMNALKEDLGNAYVIPEGASNAIGTFGYFNALREIKDQEEALGINFDTIVCAVGSGGTYAGLVFSNSVNHYGKNIVGINVCDSDDYFKEVTLSLVKPFEHYLGQAVPITKDELQIIDGYVGRGYALNTSEELDFLKDFSVKTGIILDPVYTGKAMLGLIQSLENKHEYFKESKNILFIHTGGLYGLFPKAEEFGL